MNTLSDIINELNDLTWPATIVVVACVAGIVYLLAKD